MESAMTLKTGYWVKAERGEVGKIVPISRLMEFVALPDAPKPDSVKAFLESQLTKTERPDR
jgi:hypothetical protein